MKIFSIGQTTEKELRKFTQNKIFTSKESNLEDLIKIIMSHSLKIFSIGQTTEKELRKFTQNKIFTSKESNLEDLLTIIKQNAHS